MSQGYTCTRRIYMLSGDLNRIGYPTGMAFTPVPSGFGVRFLPFWRPLFLAVGVSSVSPGTDHVRFFSGTWSTPEVAE